jgi:sulfite exporter TauE/SafE
MQSYLLAFITGLTTGGLSCLAVQGGLLASSLGNQIEKDMQAASLRTKGKKKKLAGRPSAALSQKPKSKFATPILAFLAAKLVAYTLLGFLLGLLGSMFQLSPLTRAFLQIAIGIFMVGSALRMLNVHPIFRYFVFEPPAFLRRHIRRTASAASDDSQSASLTTPALLGALTVLIPCGITQAMMAAALGTGNPWTGAALMFAFTLGASPVFFAVVYFATQLGSRLEKNFMRFVAVVMLLLGFVAIDTGLTLAGSPISFTQVINNLGPEPQNAQVVEPRQELQVFDPNAQGPESTIPQEANSAGQSDGTVVTIQIQNYGYEPRVVHAKAGAPVQLRLVSNKVYSCSLAFIAPSLGIQEFLQSTDEKVFELPSQEQGTEVPFYCSMGMFTGKIIFDL